MSEDPPEPASISLLGLWKVILRRVISLFDGKVRKLTTELSKFRTETTGRLESVDAEIADLKARLDRSEARTFQLEALNAALWALVMKGEPDQSADAYLQDIDSFIAEWLAAQDSGVGDRYKPHIPDTFSIGVRGKRFHDRFNRHRTDPPTR